MLDRLQPDERKIFEKISRPLNSDAFLSESVQGFEQYRWNAICRWLAWEILPGFDPNRGTLATKANRAVRPIARAIYGHLELCKRCWDALPQSRRELYGSPLDWWGVIALECRLGLYGMAWVASESAQDTPTKTGVQKESRRRLSELKRGNVPDGVGPACTDLYRLAPRYEYKRWLQLVNDADQALTQVKWQVTEARYEDGHIKVLQRHGRRIKTIAQFDANTPHTLPSFDPHAALKNA